MKQYTMNQINKIAAKRNGKVVAVSMEELEMNRRNEVLRQVYNGTIELQQLLNIKDKCIDMTLCEYPIQVMQKIYSAGSDVGPTTVRGQNAYMVDVTTDEGFEAFKDALVMLKDRDIHVPYTTVWKEGYNMFTVFNFENGKYYVYFVVTNEEIAALRDRITAMSKSQITKEDAAALQADLPPFVRAFQESSIDIAKDKDKVFVLDGKPVNIKAFLNTINTYSRATKTCKDSMDFGFKAVKQAKHAGKVLPAFAYTNEELAAQKPVMDLMGHACKGLEEEAVNKLNGAMHKLYAVSDNSLYAPFVNDVQISEELAYFIKSIYRICYAAKTEEVKVSEEQFATMRNAIYSKALSLGVDREDVIRVAIATAMTTVTKDRETDVITTKDADVNRFKQYPVTSIFADEFVTVVGDTVVYETIKANNKTIARIDRDIEDNEAIEFVNGISVDGTIELVNKGFTGELVELDGEFVCVKDVYKFEPIDAFLVDTTFVETADKAGLVNFSKNRKDRTICDNGEFLDSIQNTLFEVSVAGNKGGILVGNQHFLGLMNQTGNLPKGTKASVIDTISYTPDNGIQQMFLFVVVAK